MQQNGSSVISNEEEEDECSDVLQIIVKHVRTNGKFPVVSFF